MVLIRKDKHVLGQSENKQLATTGASAKADIQLQAATVTIGATIHGTIRDAGNNAVIAGALVELMDASYNPIQYTVTNADGFYAFPNIPAATYTIFVSAPGKKLTQGTTIVAAAGQIFIRDINVDSDPALSLGVITGQVKNSSGTTIPGAVVYLYKVVAGVETLVSLTGSSDDGQFIFREVDLASYKIVVTALGYTDNNVTTTVATAGQIVATTVTLSGSGNSGLGTISGVITNATGVAVNRADAILQRVEADGSLTPLAFTKTNTNGVYLFSGVPTGTFKVVSNEVEVLDVTVPSLATRPNVDKLTLSQASTTSPVTYFVADGVFTNNARRVGVNNDIAGYIGGPDGGTVTNTVVAPTTGVYTFGFNRINDAGSRPVKISVNGVVIGTYTIPGTPASTLQVWSTDLTLNGGSNTIKLEGDGSGSYSADFREVTIVRKPESVTKNTADFTLGSGAFINSSSGYINSVGGSNQGNATINVVAPIQGDYACVLTYAAGGARPLKVDLNGVNTGTTYQVPTGALGSTYTVNLTLLPGNNTIRFHNDGDTVNYTPDINKAVLSQLQYNNLTEAESATLGGSASAASGFVTNIGGSGNGTVTITKTVPYTGAYDFTITYVASTATTKMNVFVNGSDIGQELSFEQTTTMNAADAKKRTVRVNLTAGSNTIRIM